MLVVAYGNLFYLKLLKNIISKITISRKCVMKLILFKIIKKYNFKNKKNYLKLIPEIISQINSLKIL